MKILEHTRTTNGVFEKPKHTLLVDDFGASEGPVKITADEYAFSSIESSGEPGCDDLVVAFLEITDARPVSESPTDFDDVRGFIGETIIFRRWEYEGQGCWDLVMMTGSGCERWPMTMESLMPLQQGEQERFTEYLNSCVERALKKIMDKRRNAESVHQILGELFIEATASVIRINHDLGLREDSQRKAV